MPLTVPRLARAAATVANANFNAGAPGNPLDALLGNRSLYGDLGGLLVSQGAGYTTEGGNTVYGDGYIGPNDPRYMAADKYLSDNGLTQLRNTNIGGPGQPIDPSKVTYDPRYGLVTSIGNVKQYGSDIGGWGPFALAAIPAIAIAAGALSGAGATAAGGTTAASSVPGMIAPGMETQAMMESSLLNAGIMPGTAEWTSAMTGAGLDATAGGLYPTGAPTGMPPSAPTTPPPTNPNSGGLLGNLGDKTGGLLQQAGTWAMDHPLQAAGLAQTAYGLLGGGSHGASGSSGGSSKGGGGGSLGTQGIQQKFYTNPVTQMQLQRYQGGLL